MDNREIPDWLRNHPLTKQIFAEKMAETICRRTEITAKINELRAELEVASGPDQKLADIQAELDRLEAKRAALWKKFSTAYSDRRGRIHGLEVQISALEGELMADYDPQIDEAIKFFKERLDKLRMPSTIRTVEHKRTPKSLLNSKQEIYRSSNVPSVLSAVDFCRQALAELQEMKLSPAADAEKIQFLLNNVPSHEVFTEDEVYDFPMQ